MLARYNDDDRKQYLEQELLYALEPLKPGLGLYLLVLVVAVAAQAGVALTLV